MPQRRTVFFQGGHYHLYNRGNAKRIVFRGERDYLRFLDRLRKYLKEFSIKLLCYCLMPNHFHFLLRQKTEKSVAVFMQKLLVAYSMYFNKKYENVGSVFQGRFKAKLIETDSYLLQVSRYIHQNPWELLKTRTSRKSRSLADLAAYHWSSYRSYVGLEKNDLVNTKQILGYFLESNPSGDYRKFVEAPLTLNEGSELLGLLIDSR